MNLATWRLRGQPDETLLDLIAEREFSDLETAGATGLATRRAAGRLGI